MRPGASSAAREPRRRRRFPGFRLPAAAVVALAAAVPLAAADYYVAPPASGGSDANPGTLAQPWATLQHAADTVGAGDRVTVRAGSYAAFELTASGTEGAPIVFAATPGELVEIVTDLPVRGVGINLEGASWVEIEGFRIEGRAVAGIRAVLCDHVTIRGNRTLDNGRWGIFTGCCDDLVIEGNLAAGSCEEHGIYVSNSGDRPIVRGNVIHGNNSNGLHLNGDASVDCSGTTDEDGVISGALVEGNTIFDNGDGWCDPPGGGSGINGDGVQESLLRNNLIFDAHHSGISLYQIDGGEPSHGNRVENNTVIVASDGRWALNVRDGSQGTVARNNVFWSFHSYRGAMTVCDTCLPGFASDRNAVEDRFTLDDGDSVIDFAAWKLATGQDANSFELGESTADGAAALDALFVARAAANFHLAPGSAAADAGAAIGDLLRDLESVPRPQGGGHDIGAFEGESGLFADGFEGGSTARWSASGPPF
jgi:hypothetical protein